MIKKLFATCVVIVSLSAQTIAQPLEFLDGLSNTSHPQNYLYDDILEVDPYYDIASYRSFTVLERKHKSYDTTLWFTPWSCTYYVAHRRPDLFQGYGHNLLQWNAHVWLAQARAQGLEIWSEPRERAIAIFAPGRGAYSLGHVGFVEHVGDDGRIVISEMNYQHEFEITERIIPADLVEAYIY